MGGIRYIFFEKVINSNRLIVCFSGFAGHYERGRYNYVRSLSKSKSDRLFIRDDFGFHGVGSTISVMPVLFIDDLLFRI